MSTRIKRTIPVVLAAILLATVCLLLTSQRAFADGQLFTENGIEYYRGAGDGYDTDNLVRFSGYTGSYDGGVEVNAYEEDAPGGDVIIPSTVSHGGKTYVVVRIGDEAFYNESDFPNRADITSVTLPATLVQIGKWSFAGLNISEITIPKNVDMIDTFAFGGCMNLKDIRVLSAEWEDGLGGHDPFYYDGYYGPCIGYYYGESGNYEKIPGIVVTCVRTNLAGPNLDPDPLSIEEYCIDNGIDCQGFPLDKPKWEEREDGVYAVWDAPEAYINPSYTLTVMKDGKYSGQINMWAGLDEQGFLNQPTFFNFSEYMKNNGHGNYTFYVSNTEHFYYGSEIDQCNYVSNGGSVDSEPYSYTGELNSFIVDFDPDGGTGSMPALVDVAAGNSIVLPECTFTPPSPHMNFKWWNCRFGHFMPGQHFTPASNETFTAVWKDKDEADPVWAASFETPVLDLGTAETGYYPDDYLVSVITYNVGNQTIDYPEITISGVDAEKFILDPGIAVATFVPGDSWDYPGIKPIEGLPAGTYTATLTVAADEPFKPITATVRFKVTEHDFDTDHWESDYTHHWHKCRTPGCTEISGKAEHDQKVLKDHVDPTFEDDGYEGDLYCSVCDRKIENGKGIAAGKFIQESTATVAAPTEAKCMNDLNNAVIPGDAEKYSMQINSVHDNTDTSLNTYTGGYYPPDQPFISGHEYTFRVKFEAKAPYVYSEDIGGGLSYRWSSFFVNGNPAEPLAMFDCYPTRYYKATAIPSTTSIADCEITGIEDVAWTGSPVSPDIVVKYGDTVLQEGTDYSVSYAPNNIDRGTVTMTIAGISPFTGHVERSFKITRSISDAVVTGVVNMEFTGKPLTQAFTVTVAGRVLKAGADYTVSYANNTNPGTATYTISGTGNYHGVFSGSFKISKIWHRIWGATAPITMQKIAAEFGRTKSAVVTTDASYKDALAASALAGKCNGLVLMTKKGSLTPQTKAALKAAGVKTVYIVGSTGNVSATVEKQLKSGTGVTKVVRIAATTPSQRAVASAKYGGKKSDTVIITTQSDYRDALAIAPYSYVSKSPILYAEGNKKLSAATVNYIKGQKYKKAIVVGGPLALPASVDTQLKKAGVTQITRLAGLNAYATSEQIAQWTTGKLSNGNKGTYKGKPLAYIKFQPAAANKLQPNKLAVSTGQNWLDALAGAALCGKNKSVLLLADAKTSKSKYTIATAYCKANKAAIKKAYVFGGSSAVQDKVWNALLASTE